MKTAIIKICDEVNVQIKNLDVSTRNKIYKELEYFIPYARHMPSYKLGRWNGMVSFATRGGNTSLNLLDRILPIVEKAGYTLEVDDQRETYDLTFPEVTADMFSHINWPEGHPITGEPVILRDYQVEAIKTYLENPQCIQEIATGSGKTLICSALSKITEPLGRSIVIVPNRDLVTQTEADYKNLGLDVGVFYGGRKEYNRTHTICTWQSLNFLDKSTKDKKKDNMALSDEEIDVFVDGVSTIIVDEVHGAKADVLKRLLMGVFANCPIRWGLTGTVPKEDWEFLNILSAIGPVVDRLSAKELQDKDVLANCHVNVQQIQEVVNFKSYPEENKYLLTNKPRLKYISERITEISKEGNTLVLVQQIKAGELLVEHIPDSVFINGSVKSDARKEEYDSVSTEDCKVIVATYGVAAVGINIPRIFNLVLIEPGKSFVRTIQSIGRGLRRAQDKDFVQIWDFCASTKYSKRHLTERKKFYRNAEYPFKITKVKF